MDLVLCPLDQGSENFFCKRADIKYFRFCRPEDLCFNYSILPLNTKEKAWLFPNKKFVQKWTADHIWPMGPSLRTPALENSKYTACVYLRYLTQ